MFAGCAMCTDGCQHARKEIELIRHKRIDSGKIIFVGIQFLLYAVIKYNKVLNDRRLLLIQKTERLCTGFVLFQYSLLYNLINVRR